ncbi:TPR-like protein [Hymenopellis radicata]|nr:TPR-like protein [Hymenopellis radicata]
MRLWRHDAMMQHLYETAAYWGDKILSWTSDPNDAFWLAQTYFMIHQYARAERLLTRPFPINPQFPTPHTNGNASVAAPNFEPPPSSIMRLPMGPGEVLGNSGEQRNNVSTLVELSVACRYLAAQCMVRQGNWSGATEILGENNPFRDSGRSGPSIPNVDGGIKIEASMCHLRGVVMQHLSRNEIAKECYMEALILDVKCYESFERLISTEMMTPDEEWEFVQSLPYSAQVPKDAEFVQLMYTTRLRKYKHAEEHAITRQRLVQEYNLGDNPDVLYSFADSLYLSFRWKDCFTITSRILNLISIHNHTMPLHIACMFHINHLHSKLFILAHDMVDREPDNALSWYAVGVWYLGNQKWATARQYFSKASLLDPRFAAAWVAFAHTFALEGEHDHAITAYSTSARMFTGSHLPLMFIGMEQLKLSNLRLAGEALSAAYSMCDSDPLLINEMGVMAFSQGKYDDATGLFQKALGLAEVTQSSRSNWSSTYLNLGTSCRKLRRYDEAKKAYQEVLDLDPQNSVALGFMGMVHHLTGEIDKAILTYHEALSIDPINSHIMELLNMALEASSMGSTNPTETEFKNLVMALKEKYNRYHRGLAKGKERERPDVPTDVVSGNDADDMHVG